MITPLGRILIYTKKIPEMTEFYCRYFGFECKQLPGDRIVELRPQTTGCTLLLHPASKSQKEGQSLVKLVFDVEDVEAFCRSSESLGLEFGAIHHADGYIFANTKDPSKNSISISSRAFS